MERLPNEIQHIIFSNVYDLKECQRVCKSCYAMITDDLLHHSVILSSDSAKSTLYERRQDLAKHVRYLHIMPDSLGKAFALPFLFPNLQHLDVGVYNRDTSMGNPDNYNQTASLAKIPYWISSITYIKERNCYYNPFFISLWLETVAAVGETLANLTVLHIKMFDNKEFNKQDIDMRTYIIRKNQFLRSLRSVNALQYLTLEEMHVFWQDLDTIHENAPHLQSLSLVNTTLRLNENATNPYSNIDNQIEHASHLPNKQISSLKRLVIDLHSGENWNGSQPPEFVKFWIQQISLKYIDLTSFTLQCETSMRSTKYKNEDTLNMLPMMASCQRLTAYNVILYPITKDLLVAMDQNNIKLCTLAFETTHQDSLKKQLALLSHSNQSNHLQCLEIQSNYPGGHCEFTLKRLLKEEIQPFDASLFQSLSTFSRLTTLEFNCTFGRSFELAHLIQILSYCKSLRSLNIRHVSVSDVSYMTQHSGTTNLFSQLQYLTITKLIIERNSQLLVEINLILGRVLEGLQGSLRKINLEFGSITFYNNGVNRHSLANYVHLDLSKSHQLKELSVNYELGSSIITMERGHQCETHEFERNNYHFTKRLPPTSYYQTKVILPQQAIRINSLLVL